MNIHQQQPLVYTIMHQQQQPVVYGSTANPPQHDQMVFGPPQPQAYYQEGHCIYNTPQLHLNCVTESRWKKWKKFVPHIVVLALYVIANLVASIIVPLSAFLGVLNIIIAGITAYAYKKQHSYLLAGITAIWIYKLTDIIQLLPLGLFNTFSHGHFHHNGKVLIFTYIATYVLQLTLLAFSLIYLRKIFKEMKQKLDEQSVLLMTDTNEQQPIEQIPSHTYTTQAFSVQPSQVAAVNSVVQQQQQ
jgi:hypothetical protein